MSDNNLISRNLDCEYPNEIKKMRYTNNENEMSTLKNDLELEGGGDSICVQGDPTITLNQPKCVTENSLPQIAIKKIDDPSNSNTQVVLINGNWDTTNTIPNIIAEMHNVKLEEFHDNWTKETKTVFVEAQDILQLENEEVNVPAESPRGSDSGLGNDSPEGNLSWLLNFRLDEIPGLPECTFQLSPKPCTPRKTPEIQNKANTETKPKQYFDQYHVQNMNMSHILEEQPSSSKEECIKLSALSPRYFSVRKPPFTYTELIEQALREKGELTVSGIYQWISDHFSFYKANDDRWKNSVRHNLSINPHFRKGSKAVHGAGHLWTIAQRDDLRKSSTWNSRRQRMEQFLQATASEWQQQQQHDMELAAATASILQETNNLYGNPEPLNPSDLDPISDDVIEEMKKSVEVQYVIPVNNTMDFMCPVSREQVAQECGLGNDDLITDEDYLITELNPNALGLSLSETEIVTSDPLFSDDLNFHCYEFTPE